MLKRLFILCGILFFPAEPFLLNANLFVLSAAKVDKTCPVCGMVEVCGEVCCCVKTEVCDRAPGAGSVSFFKPACHNENPFTADGSPELVKYLPKMVFLFPGAKILSMLNLKSDQPADFFTAPASPPPKNA